MERAAAADGEGEDDPQALPKESTQGGLCDRLDAARRREARAKARAEAERALRGQGGGARDAHRPGQGQAPEAARRDAARRRAEQSEDPDSRLMRKSKQHEYRQAYAQAKLIVGAPPLRQRPQ